MMGLNTDDWEWGKVQVWSYPTQAKLMKTKDISTAMKQYIDSIAWLSGLQPRETAAFTSRYVMTKKGLNFII